MRLQSKMMLYILSLLLLSFAIGGNLLIHSSFENMLTQEKSQAEESYLTIRQTVGTLNHLNRAFVSSDVADIFVTLEKQGILRDCEICLQKSGETLFLSEESELFANIVDAKEVGKGYAEIINGQNGTRYYRLTSQIAYGDTLLSLQGVYNISSAYENRQTQILIYRLVFVFIFLSGTALSWIMSVWLTRPLKMLSDTSKQIAEGNFELRADIQSRDEIEALAADFNTMTDRLVNQIEIVEETLKNQEEFMGSFAHELKSPMTTILGYVGMLRMEGLAPQEQQEAYRYIYSETKRLQNLSTKLLSLFSIGKETYQFEEISLKLLISDVATAMSGTLTENHITLHITCDEGAVYIEPDLIKSLLINLIDNAGKAMPTGGDIEIDAKIYSQQFQIAITDHGRGMPKEEIGRITEAFYRVDKSRSRSQGGAGLGLALCKKIVELHHGSMTFDSLPGIGTTVLVVMKAGEEI